MKSRFTLLFMIGILFTVSYYYWDTDESRLIAAGPNFRGLDVPIQSYDMYDLGVVDVNADNFLDIYTTNHSALQSLLLNDDGVLANDILMGAGLAQTSEFPGAEDQATNVAFSQPGLYIYRHRKWLVFKAYHIGIQQPVSLTLRVPWKLNTRLSGGVILESDVTLTQSTLRFQLSGEQRVEVIGAFDIVELPHVIEVGDEVPLAQVFVGSRGISPSDRRFSLLWRDRHAMAWSDIDQDGRLDVYVARGGVKGSLAKVKAVINDEVFLQSDGLTFIDRYDEFAFNKSICPARQTSWIDINRDDRLDLHVVCGRGAIAGFLDQLWLRRTDGTFEDVAGKVGLDFPSSSVGAWFDVDEDGDQDYLASQDDQIILYRSNGGEFFSKTLVERDVRGVRKLAFADIDDDGDVDVYVASKKRSLMLINDKGMLSASSPDVWGLPARAESASWVDYDNDGFMDLHVIPDGLFRHLPGNSYAETGEMRFRRSLDRLKEGRCSWFDSNNDGYLDSVCAFGFYPSILTHHFETKILDRHSSERWSSRIYVNAISEKDNNWLQVRLVGVPGNRESIGARVVISADGLKKTGVVGQSEGAHFGQGHYRIYFGLGKASRVEEVKIYWPDGSEQAIYDVEPNRLLIIKQG